MTYASGMAAVVPPMVGPFTFGWSLVAQENCLGSPPASAGFESSNRAAYFPILLPTTCVARRMWWANGATVNATYHIDVGIYADAGYKPGARLVSTGQTDQGTASELQFVDITDLTLAPSLYWLAISSTSSSATIYRSSAVVGLYRALRMQEAAANPLPATATPVQATSGNNYLFGFATTASP